jgi:hypothetical protein
VSIYHIRPIKDLHSCSELFLPWMRDSLDSELWGSGDAYVTEQISQSASGDRSFIPKGLQLVGITIHLLIFRITRGSVIQVVFVIIIVVVVVVLVVVVVVAAVVDVVLIIQL